MSETKGAEGLRCSRRPWLETGANEEAQQPSCASFAPRADDFPDADTSAWLGTDRGVRIVPGAHVPERCHFLVAAD